MQTVIKRRLHMPRTIEARWLQTGIWIILILWTTALTLSQLDAFQIGAYSDDATYVVLARSLAFADQYGLINAPGEHPEIAPFPCGFPLMLAPFARLTSIPQAIKIPSLIATLAVASILFWGWPILSHYSRWWGLAISGLYLLAPLTVNHARMVMSEAVFTLFLLAAIWLVERIARGGQSTWVTLATGVLSVMIPITRTVGLLLLPVALAYLIVRCGRRVWRELGRLFIGGALCVGLILAFTPVDVSGLFPLRYLTESNAALLTALRLKFAPSDPALVMPNEYLQQDEAGSPPQVDDRQLIATYAQRAARHIYSDMRQLVLPAGGGDREQALADRLGLPNLPVVIGLLTFGLIVLGYVRWLGKSGVRLLSLFTPIYVVGLLFWNWDSPRLLYPVQPPLQFALLLGIDATLFGILTRDQAAKMTRYRQGGMAALIVILALVSTYSSLRIGNSEDYVGDLRARTAWIQANTNASAVLMTETPQIDYLYSERRTVPFPHQITTATALADALRQTGADYILVAPQIRWGDANNPTYSPETWELLPWIEELERQGKLSLIHSPDSMQRVYQVH
jgi:hypothetical protein